MTSGISGKPIGNDTQMLAPVSKIDPATGRRYLDIDHSMFVLNVDLWNEDGTKEVNLVRSSTGSPSISSTTPYSYTTLNGGDTGLVPYTQHVLPSNRDSAYNASHGINYVQDYQMQASYAQASPYPPNGSYGPPQQYFPHHQPYRSDGGVTPLPSQTSVSGYSRNGSSTATGYVQDHNSLARMAMVGGQPQGMFTRNLIGSLAASAFRLSDTEDRIGIWFVLQDLSVRTEGPFRLRFSFVNVGESNGMPRDVGAPKINKTRAPILACCFSEIFHVFSAKKFPGVCESTPLSKTFATQGIKIPIRKDSNVKGGDDDDYGD
ncbi:Velvet complex subunit 2 [Conoideocrella luteorostrata]|uniref:Velvet complex subunit 2 n=1 Tax=Conoideocrella luteorostrata TaxID=1105319 RepID=A0AAJ0CXS1_9HYPO|nr:Velvet complex subunit 2 [Conoideocrella luteorostrata]